MTTRPCFDGPRLSRADFLRLIGGAAVALTASRALGTMSHSPLLTRPIPKSGEALPVMGLGTWQVFAVGPDPKERAPLLEVLRLLFEGDGRVIDSSPMYAPAEKVTGDLLAQMEPHPAPFFATKVWTHGREKGIAQMEASMRYMRTERIDLMQIHNLVDWRAHLPTLRDWKERGRVRYLGITHYTPAAFDELARLIESEPLDFVQFPYSIAVRDAERRLLPLALERGVAVLVNRPFEGGDLFGSVRGRPLPDWAAEFEAGTWSQFFLKYLLGHPAVTCIIPGTAKPRHMLDNLAAGRGRLPNDEERRRMVALLVR